MSITLDQLPLADLLAWFQQQTDSSQFLDTQTSTAQIDDATITNSTIASSTIQNLTATNATLTGATITNETVTGSTISNATISTASISNLTATTVDLTNTTLHNATATGTGGRTATIIDNAGNSSFLQLKNSTTLQCVFGTNAFTGTGANIVNGTLGHGLGRTPAIVLMSPRVTSSGSGWGGDMFQSPTADTANFYPAAQAHATSLFGAGLLYYFDWLVIG